jgi:serine/threonine protein phosphatase PrpC
MLSSMEAAAEVKFGVEHFALSDVGLRRANNQDSHKVNLATSDDTWQRRGHLFIVADGMGAHAAGELASKLAVDTIPLNYHKLRDKPAHLALKKAIQDANQLIHAKGLANPDFQGMGTTTTALLLMPGGAIVAHVGDSRAYRLRSTQLEQLSFDHSLLWELTAAGQIPTGSGAPAIPRNIITRSLGPNAEVEVDLEGPFSVAAGDVFLLCSDGLSGEVNDEELGMVLQCLPLPEAAQLLVDLANLRGGPDNITVILARALTNLTDGSELAADRPSGIHPAVWVLLALTIVVTGPLAALNHTIAAIAAGAVGVALTLAACIRWNRKGEDLPRARLGRGPHKSWNCKPDGAFVQELVRIFEQLRSAAVEEDWRMDWAHIDGLMRQAQQATKNKDFVSAVASYGRAISFMMRELKNQTSA